eukprot:g74407.t1
MEKLLYNASQGRSDGTNQLHFGAEVLSLAVYMAGEFILSCLRTTSQAYVEYKKRVKVGQIFATWNVVKINQIKNTTAGPQILS